ncbi:MAG: DUF2273 domain-containing protein [Microbacteriaceae bacterium]|nr:DUF2273 domain-containing protein [Microbacteriaceae bacterium]
MSNTLIGMLIGGGIAFVWVAFGFWAMLFVVFAALVGAGVARALDGELDLRELLDVIRGRKSS